ncbi:Nanos-like 2, partial [Ophiophagus hannah]
MDSRACVPAVAQEVLFDRWKDYLNLSKVVMEIIGERKKPQKFSLERPLERHCFALGEWR